jgi:multiple antibiotic resistance protein
MFEPAQIFTFLFLMLGPFKMLGPFTRITMGEDPKLTRQIALRATLFSSLALVLAAFVGETVLTKFGIPLPILSMSGGIILFMVALLNIIHQFIIPEKQEVQKAPATLKMAMTPLAFPSIVTPYGIAAVIVFLALTPDLKGKLIVGAIVIVIMLINLFFMLINRYIYKFLALALPILGAILGVVQVALGLMIIYNSLKNLINLQ